MAFDERRWHMIRVSCRRAATLSVLSFCASFSAGVAGAEPPEVRQPMPVRLTVDAPPGCPDRDTVLASILARVGGAREARDAEPSRSFRIEIAHADGGRFAGSMTVREPDGREAHRELAGADCDSVATALALVAALTLASSARDMPPGAMAAPPATTAAPPLAESSPQDRAPAATPEPAREPPHDVPDAPGPDRSQPGDRPAPPATRIAVGTGIEVATGILPDPAVTPRLFLDVEMQGAWKRFGARVSLGRAFTQSENTPAGTGTFASTDLRLEPCFDVLRLDAGALRLGACGVVDGTLLTASGTNTTDAQSVSRSWVELGIAVRPTWVLWHRLALGLLGGVAVPTARPRFYFGPDTTAYRVAAWSAVGQATVGAYFW